MQISQAIIVEGTYDKIKLSGIVDATIVTTDGFDIFQNTQKLTLIRALAQSVGIVILTDSDRAGFMIRNFLRGAVTQGEVLNAYIPDVSGKEKRKKKSSAEGLLGVEGITDAIIAQALIDAGCTDKKIKSAGITKNDFYDDGLIGAQDSKERRTKIADSLGLPKRLSSNALLDALNRLVTFEEYKRLAQDINAAARQNGDFNEHKNI